MFLGADLDKGVWPFITGVAFKHTLREIWSGKTGCPDHFLCSPPKQVQSSTQIMSPAQQMAEMLRKSVVLEPHAALQQLKECFCIKKIFRP